MLRSVIIGVIFCVLLAACEPREARPVLVEMPTQLVLPSPTLPTATFTPSPTNRPTSTPTSNPTRAPTLTATPITWREIVIMVQPVAAGMPIPPEAVALYAWPAHYVPGDALESLDAVAGEVALVDLTCFEPVRAEFIARREVGTDFPPLPGECPPLPDRSHQLDGIVIAMQDIPAGKTITPEMIALQSWPDALVDALGTGNLADVVGQQAHLAIRRGQPIFPARLG